MSMQVKLLLNIFLHHNILRTLLLIPLPFATLLLGDNLSLQLATESTAFRCNALTFAHFFGTFSTAASTAAITFSTISSSSMSSLPTLIPEQVPVRRYKNDEPSTLRTCSGHPTRVKSTPIGAFLVE
ncbi:hypothetical protein EJB05_54017, partial [Eragrostis curvula]